MDKAEADAELTRLQRAERAFHRNQDTLRFKISTSVQRIERLTELVSEIDAAIGRRRDTRGDAFTMTLDGDTYPKRSHAGYRLMQFLDREIVALNRSTHRRADARPGQLGGFAHTVRTQRILGTVQATLALDGVPESGIRLTAKDLAGLDPAGLVIRLENRLTGLEALKAKTLSEIERMRAEMARAREDGSKAFPQADKLAAARERVREIERQFEEAAKPQQRDQPQQRVGTAAVENVGQAPGAVGISRSAFPGSVRFSDPVDAAAAQNRPTPLREHRVRPVR